jgi:hypothetical protein
MCHDLTPSLHRFCVCTRPELMVEEISVGFMDSWSCCTWPWFPLDYFLVCFSISVRMLQTYLIWSHQPYWKSLGCKCICIDSVTSQSIATGCKDRLVNFTGSHIPLVLLSLPFIHPTLQFWIWSRHVPPECYLLFKLHSITSQKTIIECILVSYDYI